MALGLITQRDSFEIVRDQIAGILVAELANQQALAVIAAEDPLEWTMDVFVERDFPIEKWLNDDGALTAETVPQVTISVETSTRMNGKSAVPGAKQVYEVTYTVDVLARGVNCDEVGLGHLPADVAGRKACHAAVRIVRNILSATENRRLMLPAIVWGHPHFQSFEYGQAPTEETQPNIGAWVGRGRFMVQMTEFSPEFVGEPLEVIHIDVSDDGGVILSAEYTSP